MKVKYITATVMKSVLMLIGLDLWCNECSFSSELVTTVVLARQYGILVCALGLVQFRRTTWKLSAACAQRNGTGHFL